MKGSIKIFISFFSLIIFSYSVQADNASLSERLKKPVYVVYDETNASFNDNIKNAVENFWTVSSFEFITHEQFKELKKTEDNIFMMLIQDEVVDGSSNTYPYVIELFYMVRGTYRNNITGVPVSKLEDASAKTELVTTVRLLQDKLNFKIAKEEQNSTYANFDEQVQSRTAIIKSKKLFISKEDLDNNYASLDAIKSVYKGDVQVVSKDELQALINSKKADAVYVSINNYKNGASYENYKQVIDAQSGLVLYSKESKSKNPEMFDKNDFERIQK